MKKLFKKLRLKLNLFTRKELIDFADEMLEKHADFQGIWHSDVENFIHDLNNN